MQCAELMCEIGSKAMLVGLMNEDGRLEGVCERLTDGQ